ncbi:hypothetical protein DFH08DRAFT_968862 [Mycena albidolilacea]|uniref:HAT C-terminal dimerisation domain-containing protein n=1 Tax=Mycena albidolilacea TaxID=1033008 RepID=A0AAD7EIJ7_9AGAR|nr:hypothetical protein DFH08DRAFT_968862 [Mycena albidolilacea]
MSYKDREARKLTGYMLILDVKIRWSSTHQMLWRALEFKLAVDNYVAKSKDLRALELSKEDWEAIELVAQWVEAFRTATTQMSATKSPMISTTHAVFRGLQEELRKLFRSPFSLGYFGFAQLDWLLGSAVAVESIFSGGRDTISLRRVSLKAEAISTLMFVKNQLRMRRNTLNVELGEE